MNLYCESAKEALNLASAANGRAQMFALTSLITGATVLVPLLMSTDINIGFTTMVVYCYVIAIACCILRLQYKTHRGDYVRFLICAELQQIADEMDCTILELGDETLCAVADRIEERTTITRRELRRGIADMRDDASILASECGWISIESSAA